MSGKDTPPSKAGGPMKRTKRIRINFTHRQIEAMETVFRQTQYPDVTVIEVLAERLQLPIEKICTWFQNRRSKFRKESKKGHIHWMRQQVFGNSDVCTGLPVTSGVIDAATPSSVLAPPTSYEQQQSAPTARMSHPAYDYQPNAHISDYITPTNTPSQQYPMSGSPFNSCDMYADQSQSIACMTSWSGQESLSSPQQYSSYGTNTLEPCAFANAPEIPYQSASPPLMSNVASSPDSAYMSASPSSETYMGASPTNQSCMGASPTNQSCMGASPNNQTYTGASPNNQAYAGASPNNQAYTGASPTNQSCMGASPNNQAYQGTSPNNQAYTGASPSSEMYFGASPNSQACMGASPNGTSYGNVKSPTDTHLPNAEGLSPQLSYYGTSQHYGYQSNQQNTNTASKSTYELYKEWCNAWGNNPPEKDAAVSSNCVNQQPSLISI